MKFFLRAFSLMLLSCSQDNVTIKIKGSDTEVNLAVLLAEDFHKVNSDAFVSISGGGSGLGIASLLNGTADVANSSRSIKKTEIGLFQKKAPKLTRLFLPRMLSLLLWPKAFRLIPLLQWNWRAY